MAVPIDIDAAVLSNTRLSPDYNVLVLAAPQIAATSQPGQFVMIRTTTGTDPLLRRPFSVFEILRHPNGTAYALSLLVKRAGPGSTRLYETSTGFTIAPPPAEAWMVAGGVGLAPFATLAESLRAEGTPAALYYGGRTDRDLFYLEWFSCRGVRLELATEDGSRGECGRVTVPLERDLASASPTRSITLYACGPEPMLKAVARLAAAHARPVQVSTEQIMGCGLGGCYSCVVRVRDGSEHGHFVRSCLSGPVFSGDAIVWE